MFLCNFILALVLSEIQHILYTQFVSKISNGVFKMCYDKFLFNFKLLRSVRA